MRFTTDFTRKQFLVFTGAVLGGFAGFLVSTTAPYKTQIVESTVSTEVQSEPVRVVLNIEESIVEPVVEEVLTDEFTYYSIPEEYKEAGGNFPEEVQEYLWELCTERELDYYIAVALIERESGYRAKALGDSGKSKGYMQVQERWHIARMKEEGVEDLLSPYENLRVGINYLDELYERYGDYDKALMAYNMGESRAKKCWEKGLYSSNYSDYVTARAEELKQELEQD